MKIICESNPIKFVKIGKISTVEDAERFAENAFTVLHNKALDDANNGKNLTMFDIPSLKPVMISVEIYRENGVDDWLVKIFNVTAEGYNFVTSKKITNPAVWCWNNRHLINTGLEITVEEYALKLQKEFHKKFNAV